MKALRMLVVAGILVSAATAMLMQTAFPVAQYTQQTGKACSFCHVNPAGGPELNAAGEYYKEHRTLEGYQPPEKAPPGEAPPEEVPPAEVPEAPPPPPPEAVEPEAPPAVPPTVEEEAPPPPQVEVRGMREEFFALPPTGADVTAILVTGFGLVAIGILLYRRAK